MIPIWTVLLVIAVSVGTTWAHCRIEDGTWGPRLKREVAEAEARVRAEMTPHQVPRRIEIIGRRLEPAIGRWWPATWEEMRDLIPEIDAAVDKAIVEVMTRPRDKS